MSERFKSELLVLAALFAGLMMGFLIGFGGGEQHGKRGADRWYANHPVYQQITGDNNTTDLDPACEQ